MSIEQSIQSARRAGFTGDPLVTIIAIATAESDNNGDAVNDTRRFSGQAENGQWRDPQSGELLPSGISPEYSLGPLQINILANPEVTEDQARDFDAAFAFAWWLSDEGRNFGPWSTFPDLNEAQWRAAALAIADVPEAEDAPTPMQVRVVLDQAQSEVMEAITDALTDQGVPAYATAGPGAGQITISVTVERARVVAGWPALDAVLPVS